MLYLVIITHGYSGSLYATCLDNWIGIYNSLFHSTAIIYLSGGGSLTSIPPGSLRLPPPGSPPPQACGGGAGAKEDFSAVMRPTGISIASLAVTPVNETFSSGAFTLL